MNSDTVMGFDFGLKSIGVAVGQRVTRSGSPLMRLKARQGIPIWELLDQLIKEWKPSEFVVGIPLKMDGSEQPVTQHAKSFARTLKKRYHIPTFGVDERLTTVSAREKLFSARGFKALKKENIDQLSAVFILENYFNPEHELLKF